MTDIPPKRKKSYMKHPFALTTSLFVYKHIMSPHYNENTFQSSSEGEEAYVTVLGFGSLLSEKSSRVTFPNLINFRLGTVPNYRRVFAHPSSIFFKHNIACMDTLQIASLSAEYSPDSSFICSVFEVPSDGIMENYGNTAAPSEAFLKREASYDIQYVYYHEKNGRRKKGILCLASTDEEYIQKWGYTRYSNVCKHWDNGNGIWNWEYDSGLRPNAVYLRHCLVAAKKIGKECLDSLLDDTYLVDRETTIREYLEEHPQVWNSTPPAKLSIRYGG